MDISISYYGCPMHAQAYMKSIGVTYQEAIPQTLGECWWFLDCENLPPKDEWPEFMTELVGVREELHGNK